MIVAGIDVGGTRKGFHAVALQRGKYFDQFASSSPLAIANWCRQIGAHFIGVDAPCCWSLDGRARPAERELMQQNIWCFSTPTKYNALSHPKDHYRWMLKGAELYQQLQSTHPLFEGRQGRSQGPLCFETFPQAIACALAEKIVSAKSKRTVRRQILSDAGMDTGPLSNIDKIDAALCALAADYFSRHATQSFGDAESGLLVTPNPAML